MIRRALLVLLMAGGAALAQVALAQASSDCRADTVLLRGDWGQARFSVEIADTPDTRSRGLMFRETMAKSAGMLFVYDTPQRATFWMRNTLISLDMIFADERGVVRHVHHNAIPGDETVIDGGRGILAVLEINGGLARAMGIVPGSQMRHPAFASETAAWPC
ncbi:DUF192 domain-containing protein [Seohaeicola saemankumensis]|uniref:DUF192 domain-containing protein n=1 Tax=Seohaeicola saemankumensis TaxID=481181 RepID=A0ABW3TB62_9RHOB